MVVATARTDFDGFFLFERAAYGRYTLRIAAASAKAAGVPQDLHRELNITPDKAIVRLGPIQVGTSRADRLHPVKQSRLRRLSKA